MLKNQKLEQSLIGAAVLNEAVLSFMVEKIVPEDFYFVEHQRIWGKICKSNSIDKGENSLTIKDFIDHVGGSGYLNILLASASGIDGFIKENLLELKSLAKKRMIVFSAQEAINACGHGELTVEEIREELERSLASLENQREGRTERASDAMLRVATRSTASHDGSNAIISVKTRFDELDNLTGGFRPSELIVLAGATGSGKSTLASNIAVNAAKQGKAVILFSFEMSSDQISTRIQASENSILANKIKNGYASMDERALLEKKAEFFKKIPLIIQDTSNLNIVSLRARIKKVIKKEEVGLVVVDYLQQIRATRRGNRVEEVSEVTRALKEMAIEFDIPILALSQLSRAVDTRENNRPQLSDLRESGSIEQDANIVIFIYREDYYLQRQQPKDQDKLTSWKNKFNECKGLAEIIVAKQRDGELGSFFLRFESEFTRFINHYSTNL